MLCALNLNLSADDDDDDDEVAIFANFKEEEFRKGGIIRRNNFITEVNLNKNNCLMTKLCNVVSYIINNLGIGNCKKLVTS